MRIPYSQAGAEDIYGMDRHAVCTWIGTDGKAYCTCVGGTCFRIGLDEETCNHSKGIIKCITDFSFCLGIPVEVIRKVFRDVLITTRSSSVAQFVQSLPKHFMMHNSAIAVVIDNSFGATDLIETTPVRILKKGNHRMHAPSVTPLSEEIFIIFGSCECGQRRMGTMRTKKMYFI